MFPFPNRSRSPISQYVITCFRRSRTTLLSCVSDIRTGRPSHLSSDFPRGAACAAPNRRSRGKPAMPRCCRSLQSRKRPDRFRNAPAGGSRQALGPRPAPPPIQPCVPSSPVAHHPTLGALPAPFSNRESSRYVPSPAWNREKGDERAYPRRCLRRGSESKIFESRSDSIRSIPIM